MKKILLCIAAIGVAATFLASCSDDDEETTWEQYAEWRETNDQWLKEMAAKKNPDGTSYYKVIVPEWNPSAYVLMHYFNDRAETEGNLSPLYTSTVDVRYEGHLCNGEPFDSSTNVTTWGPGIYRTRPDQTIQAWMIALPQMRCGDTAEIICPYDVAYGSQQLESIDPYSALRFNLRLVDIYKYEASPY